MEKKTPVKIEGLSYTYPGAVAPALVDVTVELFAGEFVLLLGESGSGKSTLCRVLNGLVPHFYGGTIGGTATIFGNDSVESSVKKLSRRVGMVFQDPESQLVTNGLETEVSFGLENLGIDRPLIRKRTEEVLGALRLGALRERELNRFSGGEKQKTVLASALAMHPDLLVLDEPTSQLDPISAEEFMMTLKSLNSELGLSVFLAEHRVERCFHLVDRVLFMQSGKLLFDGTPSEATRFRTAGAPLPLPPITRLFSGTRFCETPPLNVKEGRQLALSLLESAAGDGGDDGPALTGECFQGAVRTRGASVGQGPAPGEVEAATPILRVRSLCHRYENNIGALERIDLTVQRGESIVIIGENGAGKTTLIRHFNGLLLPTSGTVELHGMRTDKTGTARLARHCGMLGQNPNLQLISESTKGELETTLSAMGVPREEWERMIRETLEALGIMHLEALNPSDLSCGERERVALASIVVHRPDLLVLDEPTRGIDLESKEMLSGFLKDYSDNGGTVIVVTHDLEFAVECCDRVIMMGNGRIVADGEKHEVLSGSLFFTTQYSRCFREISPTIVTRAESERLLEGIR